MLFSRFAPSAVRQGAWGLGVAVLCSTVGAPAAAQTAGDTPEVTFTRDIAPIFQQNCQQCHRPGSIGPMSLTTYQEVRPWARSIKQRVVTGEMPPYRYDRDIGIQELKDDLRLSLSEIDTIARWVDAGAPPGATRLISRRRCPSRISTSGPTRTTSARRTW